MQNLYEICTLWNIASYRLNVKSQKLIPLFNSQFYHICDWTISRREYLHLGKEEMQRVLTKRKQLFLIRIVHSEFFDFFFHCQRVNHWFLFINH